MLKMYILAVTMEIKIMKTSIKCQNFVAQMTNAQILRVIAQKSKSERINHLIKMDIPKSYLPEIERVADERGLLRMIDKKRANRISNRAYAPKYDISLTWLYKLKNKLRDDTLKKVKAEFNDMFDFKGSNFVLCCYLSDKFAVTTQKIIDWTSGRKWKPSHTEINVYIPRDYRKSVLNKGLMVLDGLITISAELVHSYANVKIYYANYVSHGRGYNVVQNRGLIVTDGNTHYHYNANHLADVDDVHANHIQAAIADFEAKLQGRNVVKQRAKATKGAEREAFVNKLMTMKQELVSFELARKAGACHVGIVNWLNQTGLLDSDDVPDNFAITLQQFANAYQKIKRAECLTVFKFWGKSNGFKMRDCDDKALAALTK